MEKKSFSVKELGKVLGVNEVSLRSWIMKGEIGEIYDSRKVNYKNLKRMILKYFESEEKFKEKFGFEIDEIEIVKREKGKNEYLKIEELEVGEEYVIMNYSLRYKVKLLDILNEDEIVYLFKDLEKKSYKVYGISELEKENIKFVK